MSAITDKIRSKGYWDVTIRPKPYDDNRVGYGELEEILTKAAVRLRGWPVPFIDHREPVTRGASWIGQDVNAEVVEHFEAWRFFMSGQFNHLRAVSADWRTGREATRVPEGAASAIEIWEILYYVTEVYELAARLALGPAGGEGITVSIQLNGLEQRALVVGQPNRVPFSSLQLANMPSFEQAIELPRSELVGDPQWKAVETSREFFLRFGWNPSLDQLKELQRELIERG